VKLAVISQKTLVKKECMENISPEKYPKFEKSFKMPLKLLEKLAQRRM